jgi:hypothetical protein
VVVNLNLIQRGGRNSALELPEGVVLEAGTVHTADHRVLWRVRADEPGDPVLSVRVGGRPRRELGVVLWVLVLRPPRRMHE